jgi:hypothetical protein
MRRTTQSIFAFSFLLLNSIYTQAQVGIGTTTPSSKLEIIGAGTNSATTAFKVGTASGTIFSVRNDGLVEVASTTQGFLPPRMTASQRNAISTNPPEGLMVYCIDCSLGELQFFNRGEWKKIDGTSASSALAVGTAALGGKIAYLLQPGDQGYDANVLHGLVATLTDVSAGAEWGCWGNNTIGANGTAIGTGNQNTTAILAGCSTAGIAARLCGDLVQGGYSDWYLPSQDELNKLYINRVAIGGFFNANYFTSTEGPLYYAYIQNFTNGEQTLYGDRRDLYRVRAIRSF